MQHHLENDLFRATFKEQGAELCSLRGKKNGIEYIWQGDPSIWGRHAPILFPIVGKLQNNKYSYNGKEYILSQHGFARDRKWELVTSEDKDLSFRLVSGQDTLEHFPFHFELYIHYSLDVNRLTTTYEVVNKDEQEMLFSIGGHPAFNCPFEAGEQFEDYYLEFAEKETLSRELLNHGLRNGKVQPVLENENKLALKTSLFEHDALVFRNIKSEEITLKSDKHPHKVKVSFPDFPYLGIWTKAGGTPFICIEPWFGIADKEGNHDDFSAKEGIQRLAPGKTFTCHYTIEVAR